MKISIIGSEFVGEEVGRGLASLCNVNFYDVIDKNLPNLAKDINSAIANSDISFIRVPTPTAERKIDLRYIEEAAKNVGAALASQQNYHVVVIKSTVVPTTTEEVVIPILEKCSGKNAGEFGVCMNPEFLTGIESSWIKDKEYKRDFLTEDLILIGEYDRKSGDVI